MSRIGYICTYTPLEIISAAGFTPYRLLPPEGLQLREEDLLAPNLCPYIRKVAGALLSGYYPELEKVVVARSCEAALHLYNVLRKEKEDFFYLLDVPRKNDKHAKTFFAGEIKSLGEFLGLDGEKIDSDSLLWATKPYRETFKLLDDDNYLNLGPDVYDLIKETNGRDRETFNRHLSELIDKKTDKETLLLTGAIPPEGLLEILKDTPYDLIVENCTGIRSLLNQKYDSEQLKQDPFLTLSGSYLNRPPCPRLIGDNSRFDFLETLLAKKKISGVIYHDLGFCDLAGYDYVQLKGFFEERKIPLLKVKTEMASGEIGQLLTRVEAFLEMLS